MATIETLLEYLAEYGGKIVSTASLTPEWINQARASNRMYVDEKHLGYVWMPEMDMPTTDEEVILFDRGYPLPVEIPEHLKNFDIAKEIEKRELEEKQKKNN